MRNLDNQTQIRLDQRGARFIMRHIIIAVNLRGKIDLLLFRNQRDLPDILHINFHRVVFGDDADFAARQLIFLLFIKFSFIFHGFGSLRRFRFGNHLQRSRRIIGLIRKLPGLFGNGFCAFLCLDFRFFLRGCFRDRFDRFLFHRNRFRRRFGNRLRNGFHRNFCRGLHGRLDRSLCRWFRDRPDGHSFRRNRLNRNFGFSRCFSRSFRDRFCNGFHRNLHRNRFRFCRGFQRLRRRNRFYGYGRCFRRNFSVFILIGCFDRNRGFFHRQNFCRRLT